MAKALGLEVGDQAKERVEEVWEIVRGDFCCNVAYVT